MWGTPLNRSVTLYSRPTQIHTQDIFSIPESSLGLFPSPSSLTDLCHTVWSVLDFYTRGIASLVLGFWLVSVSVKPVTVTWVGAFTSNSPFTAECSSAVGTRHGHPLPLPSAGVWALPGWLSGTKLLGTRFSGPLRGHAHPS